MLMPSGGCIVILERLCPGLEARGYFGLEILALESGHLRQATEVMTHGGLAHLCLR